ncbi:MAG: hypothetical protein JOY99_17670 [Sphingomonadaceae bacterium]|nr:hypothetical protein [Sphingomonadaceae bacterium]
MKPSRDLVLPAAAPTGPEAIRYTARPGLKALPESMTTMLGFGALGLFPVFVFLWAVWWPYPTTPTTWTFAIGATILIVGLSAAVFWLLFGRRPAQILNWLLAPFMRITVTDRRVLWTLPWRRRPLYEIAGERVRGGLLGDADRAGIGAAAIMLFPGDPAGDAHGLVHFDRLPDVAGFVDALVRLA